MKTHDPATPSPLKPRILVVEDEHPMRTALSDCLQAEGYRVLLAENGERGLARAVEEKPDLVILDIMMPRLDGYAVCSELRRLGMDTPVLFLTAKGQVQDRVQGLDSGGDDYLVKPFSLDELLARVRALLRRLPKARPGQNILLFGANQVDLNLQTTTDHKGELIHLTPKEYAMLRLMSTCPGEPVSRERFLDVVWGYAAFPTTRTVDTHIASLRSKLELDPNHPRHLLTVHGVGYRLEPS